MKKMENDKETINKNITQIMCLIVETFEINKISELDGMVTIFAMANTFCQINQLNPSDIQYLMSKDSLNISPDELYEIAKNFFPNVISEIKKKKK